MGTFRRNLSKASFRLNIRRRSLILAALLWAMEAIRRRVFLEVVVVPLLPELEPEVAREERPRWVTKGLTWERGQRANGKKEEN